CNYAKKSEVPFNGNIKLDNKIYRYGIKCQKCGEIIKFQYLIKNNKKEKLPILIDRKLLKNR
ncbi:MAG: hypothetical protein PHS81_04375, partial [Candidatus Nanoarchaeia archaeon]|nr:hypothetical protein [Candidatus Nanoarchaeia archaeon]